MRWTGRLAGRALRLIAITSLMGGATAHAQIAQGNLRGALCDARGVVPAAEITLLNEDTHAARTVRSNGAGVYAFANVPPGSYAITVVLSGFQPAERRGVPIGVQANTVLDFTLEPGSPAEAADAYAEQVAASQRERSTDDAFLDEALLQNVPVFGPATQPWLTTTSILSAPTDPAAPLTWKPAVRR